MLANRLNSLRRRKSTSGFTLIEIMIVVLIIGILLAIALPNFVRAREQSRAKACSANLKSIQSAVQQYAIDNKLGETSTSPALSTLVGATGYINGTTSSVSCPSGGAYSFATVGTAPTCDKTSAAYPHTVTGQ